MKIEIGESLFYSWLRHVKVCQIVQTNWTTSTIWELQHEDELQKIMNETARFFDENYGYKIYKKNASLSQILKQAECDVIGLSFHNGTENVYAVDVAFHESGLNYLNRKTTVMKIIAKCLRTAMCIYGYLDKKEAEIIFASPKVSRSILNDVTPCIKNMQEIMDSLSFDFQFRIIANEDFKKLVIDQIEFASEGVSDTNELFMRSYQMTKMFDGNKGDSGKAYEISDLFDKKAYTELKIGKLAQLVMGRLLTEGYVSNEEIKQLQGKEYSKKVLGLNFPALVDVDGSYDAMRYYKAPLKIRGKSYRLCSQWSESKGNNDRPYLLAWIENHNQKSK